MRTGPTTPGGRARARARARLTAGTTATALAVLLAACGGGSDGQRAAEPGTGGTTGTATAPPQRGSGTEEQPQEGMTGTVVEVTVEDGRVTPLGERVRVAVGEPVTLRVTSDTADEAHVHSTPEQSFAIAPGTHEHVVTVPTPGLVPVELHELGTTVVQLEVR